MLRCVGAAGNAAWEVGTVTAAAPLAAVFGVEGTIFGDRFVAGSRGVPAANDVPSTSPGEVGAAAALTSAGAGGGTSARLGIASTSTGGAAWTVVAATGSAVGRDVEIANAVTTDAKAAIATTIAVHKIHGRDSLCRRAWMRVPSSDAIAFGTGFGGGIGLLFFVA